MNKSDLQKVRAGVLSEDSAVVNQALAILDAALAAPEQEPVAWINPNGNVVTQEYLLTLDPDWQWIRDEWKNAEPLYRHPAPQSAQTISIPDFPESMGASDLDYTTDVPESWDEDFKRLWVELQVCQRNKNRLHNYAKQLRELLTKHAAPPSPQSAQPVAWVSPDVIKSLNERQMIGTILGRDSSRERTVPIYTAPPSREWQGLSDEERQECQKQALEGFRHAIKTGGVNPPTIDVIVEELLRTKNTGER